MMIRLCASSAHISSVIYKILIYLVVSQVAELQEEAGEAAGPVSVEAGGAAGVAQPPPHHRPVRPRQQQGQHQVLSLATAQAPVKVSTFCGKIVKFRKISLLPIAYSRWSMVSRSNTYPYRSKYTILTL